MGPYSVRPKVTRSLWLEVEQPPQEDTIRLDADVYVPDGEGPFPALLMRQPYGRSIASTVVYAHPIWYASHGYIVVIQDVRGRGTSEGIFDLFRQEAKDGYASVLWAANLPYCDGQVGMYGFSYQGMTQLYAAAEHPAPLKTIIPAMAGYDLYRDKAYENGSLLLQAGLGWALQLAAETARLKGNELAFHELLVAAQRLPLYESVSARPQVLNEFAADSFFHDWLDHPHADSYWQALAPDLSQVDLPMLHIGGWFDPYLRGNIRLYTQMRAQSTCPQHLWVGPWGHIPWGRRVGARDFGEAADNPIDTLQLRWFNWILKGQDSGLAQEEPVCLFTLGANHWQALPNWPANAPQSFYLTSTGLAGMRQDDGQLILADAAPDDMSPSRDGEDVLVHDPWRPVPSLGGHAGVPSGAFDRSAIDCRSDVLTYTTAFLPEDVRVAGSGSVQLFCRADAPSFDVSVVVSEVFPDGRVMNLTQGQICVKPKPTAPFEGKTADPDHTSLDTDIHQVTIPFQPTCFMVPAGHSLRLSVAAACFPAYAVNPGTGQAAGQSRRMEQRIITLQVLHGPSYQSRLDLPMN